MIITEVGSLASHELYIKQNKIIINYKDNKFLQ